MVMGDPIGCVALGLTPYQAELGTYSNGSVDTNYQGYTGMGFVNTVNNSGEWVQFVVNVPCDREYDLSLRYALKLKSPNSNKPALVEVDGELAIASLIFPTTSSWSDWTTVDFNLTLTAGANTIRFTALNGGGLANIDRLDISAALTSQINNVWVEGVAINDPDGADHFDAYSGIAVTVSDGKLTITEGAGADNPKLNYIDISSP